MTESRVIITADANRGVAEFQRFRTSAVGALDHVSQAGSVIGKVLGVAGASLSIAAFTGWIKGAIDATDAASDLSQKTGIAIGDLAGMELAFKKGGMEAGALEATMSKLSKQIVDGNDAFEKLGVKTKDASGQLKSNKDMVYELADKFADMEDGVQKTALAQEIFGKSGAAMIPMLNEGSEGLRAMDEMARKLGLSLSEEAVEQAGNFNDTLDLLAMGGQGVARGIAAELLPTLSNLTGQFLTTMTSGDKLKNTAAFLAAGLKILYTVGIGIVEVFSTVGKTIGAAGAQLVAALQGNFSQAAEIGRMWQKDVGDGWAATVKSIKAAWADSGNAAVDSMINFTRHSTVVGKSAAELTAESKKLAKAQDEEAKLLAELSGYTATFADDRERLNDLYAKGAISYAELGKAQAALLAKQPIVKAAAEEEIAERKLLVESAEQYAKASDLAAEAKARAVAGLQAQKDENELIGLGALALAELNAVRTESRATRAEENAEIAKGMDLTGELAQKYLDEAAALRELAAEQRAGARKKIAADEAKSAEEAWKRGAENIEKSLTDALLRGFESGQSIGENLVSTLKNMFNTLVLRPVIQAVVTPMSNQISGLIGQFTGATGSTGSGGSKPGVPAAGGGTGMLTGGAASVAGWIAAGMAAADALYNKGFDPNNGSTNTALTNPLIPGAMHNNKIFQALGMDARWANMFSGASVVTALFGRKNPEVESQGIRGSFGGAGFTGQAYANILEKGGLFRSDKRYEKTAALGTEQQGSFDATFKGLMDAAKGFASTLGLEAGVIEGYNKSIKLELGKDEAANQAAITKLFGEIGDELSVRLVPSIASFTKAGETASSTLQRLATDYATVDGALNAIGMTFGLVGEQSLAARERLLEAAGGRDAFAANAAGFQQNFLTEAERNAPVLKAVTGQLAAMGLAAIDTRDEFKQYLLSLNPADAEQGKQLATLLNMQAAFAQVYPVIGDTADALAQINKGYQDQIDEILRSRMSAEELRKLDIAGMDASTIALYDRLAALREETAAIEELAVRRAAATQAAKDHGADLLAGLDDAFAALQSVVGREKALLQESANAHRALSSTLRGALDGMKVSGQEREDRQGAQAQVRAALAIAKATGVLPDVDSIKGALSMLGKDSSAMFATQKDYLRDFYATQNDISDLAGLTDKRLSAEEESIKRLDGILESARQQIDALKGIDTSIFSLAEAIRGFDRAIEAVKADPVASAGGELQKLYKELLGRQIDSTGLKFYSNRMAEGVTLAQIRAAIMQSDEYKAQKGIPGFDKGGDHVGGLRFVGERSIELEATGPSRIHSTKSLMDALRNPVDGNAALVAEVRALRGEVERLRRETSRGSDAAEETARSSGQLAEQFDNATDGGNAFRADVVNVVKTKEVV